MIIKKYVVNSMNEAITRIRYELGKDAVIISQRKIKKPGFYGFFSKKMLEVTAAIDNNHKNKGNMDIKDSIDTIKNIVDKNKKDQKLVVREREQLEKKYKDILNKREKENYDRKEVEAESYSKEKIFDEIKDMKELITEVLSKNGNGERKKSEIEEKLIRADVKEEIINEILEKIKYDKSTDKDEEKLKKIMESMIKVSKKNKDKVTILIGPTGVGKTTTIAKLAGKYALIDQKKVGLITIDTYRIGAVEQLKTYADIMNIPFKVVFNIDDIQMAIESMAGCDIILVDTTGRSSKNVMQISELRAYIEKVNTSNIHLVLSATTKNNDIISITKGYDILGYNNVIITKLDETTTCGSIINILKSINKPISFITTGQNVPDDIKVPTKRELVNLIIGENSIC